MLKIINQNIIVPFVLNSTRTLFARAEDARNIMLPYIAMTICAVFVMGGVAKTSFIIISVLIGENPIVAHVIGILTTLFLVILNQDVLLIA